MAGCYTPAGEGGKKTTGRASRLPPIVREPRFPGEEENPVAVIIDFDLCEASGVCAEVCPDDVFEHKNQRTEVIKPELCSLCFKCVESCTSGAIELD